MKTIIKFSEDRKNILGFQNYISSKLYRNSPFIITEEMDKNLLVYNTLTCELISMTDSDYQLNKEFLVRHWFMIPEDVDPYSICKMFKHIYINTKKKKTIDKLSHYTILTTTNCNARCPYCYESGCIHRDMSLKTADDIADYIIKTNSGNITIQWFGGEPLYNGEVINSISKKLKGCDLVYSASMISNGYLFDKYDIKTILEDWKLKWVQITLDGTEKLYNQTKNYIYNDDNPFKRVIQNIEHLLQNGIDVNVRLNLSSNNIGDMRQLVDILYSDFGKYKNFKVYSHNLFNSDSSVDGYLEIQKKIAQYNLCGNYRISRSQITRNCIANDLKSVVINPEGKLSLCEHYVDEEFIGDIYHNELDSKTISEWQEEYFIEKCKTCVFYPQCTKIKKCPVGQCSDEWKKHLDFQIKSSMAVAYKNMEGR